MSGPSKEDEYSWGNFPYWAQRHLEIKKIQRRGCGKQKKSTIWNNCSSIRASEFFKALVCASNNCPWYLNLTTLQPSIKWCELISHFTGRVSHESKWQPHTSQPTFQDPGNLLNQLQQAAPHYRIQKLSPIVMERKLSHMLQLPPPTFH